MTVQSLGLESLASQNPQVDMERVKRVLEKYEHLVESGMITEKTYELSDSRNHSEFERKQANPEPSDQS